MMWHGRCSAFPLRTTRIVLNQGKTVMGNGSALAGFLLLFGVMSASSSSAQTPSAAGAFERMSAGNQKIARALFDAQTAIVTPAPPGARSARALTLDEIAAVRQSGQGWGQVFQTMRSQGLLNETSLGQVVSRYESRRTTAAAKPASPAKDATRTLEEAAQK